MGNVINNCCRSKKNDDFGRDLTNELNDFKGGGMGELLTVDQKEQMIKNMNEFVLKVRTENPGVWWTHKESPD